MPRWPKQTPRPGVDEYGRTPLWYRALEGDLAGTQHEIAERADPSVGDDAGYTPLHAAVQEGHVAVIALLLKAGANRNAVDEHGNNPLWTAVLSTPNKKKLEIIRMLLKLEFVTGTPGDMNSKEIIKALATIESQFADLRNRLLVINNFRQRTQRRQIE